MAHNICTFLMPFKTQNIKISEAKRCHASNSW